MSGFWRAWVLLGLVLSTCLFASPAAAHDFRPAVLRVDEVGNGKFLVAWKPTRALAVRGAPTYEPRFPEHCSLDGALLDCGERGLVGELGISGVSTGYLDVAVDLRWQNGSRTTRLLNQSQPSLQVGTSDSVDAVRYFRLGIEHILTGLDHVLFVIGLTLLTGLSRRLLGAVTAFTAGHALSLAASVLGLVRLPQDPVEILIAASVLLLAVELSRRRETITSTWPGVVALGFGLVHGLGFASALREIGLPQGDLGGALLRFNLGIEVGQLLVVGVVLAAMALVSRMGVAERWRRLVPAYALGSLAAAWLIERLSSAGGWL